MNQLTSWLVTSAEALHFLEMNVHKLMKGREDSYLKTLLGVSQEMFHACIRLTNVFNKTKEFQTRAKAQQIGKGIASL